MGEETIGHEPHISSKIKFMNNFKIDDIQLCEQCSSVDSSDEVEVKCEDGVVKGITTETCYGPKLTTFHGVPYAKPPVGPLRFLPPQPFGPWKDTVDATQPKEGCYSYRVDCKRIIGTEDCLFTTIHTKNIHTKDPVPVMFFICGTGYLFDSHHYFGPGWLTNEDVVVVFCSYRLSVFGFLSIREATAPGNCGLKDVVLALRWVQRNISAFGGDPNNVTLFGTGSGASMVHYMMLSPLADGLYHKAIIQSGSALHNWALSHRPVIATMSLAKEFDIDTKDPNEVVEQLKALSAMDLMLGYVRLLERQNQKELFYKYDAIFKPSVEDDFEGQRAFLTNYPYYLIKAGKFNKIPIMIGSNIHEAKTLKKFMLNKSQVFKHLTIDKHTLVPKEFGLEEKSTGMKNLGNRLLQFYMQGEEITENSSEGLFNFLTDYYFIYYINRCVKVHCKHADKSNPVYYYILQTAGEWRLTEDLQFISETGLGSELLFLYQLFGCSYYSCSSETNRMRRKVIKLWTNFAKHGNPTPTYNEELLQISWEPVTDPNKINYLSIGPDLTKGCNPFRERMSFWDSVLDETNFLRFAALF